MVDVYFFSHSKPGSAECILRLSVFLPGVVFDNLESNAIEYTLRFRHEVGQRNTWFTDVVVSTFQLAGPRVNK